MSCMPRHVSAQDDPHSNRPATPDCLKQLGRSIAGASAADIAAARLGRSLKLWLDLQASVNGFIDSTTADKGVLVSLVSHWYWLGNNICCGV